MSSIRLFVLSSLADAGEMHGHQLRQQAEKEHIHMWTDISVGSLYGALKRMGAEGLIEEARTEQVGSYPERQVWRITRAGRISLAAERLSALHDVVFHADPVDLGLARVDRDHLDDVPELVQSRLAALEQMLAEAELHNRRADPYLSPLERAVLHHKPARLRAEIAWHRDLLTQLPSLLADETSRKDSPRD